MKQVRVVVRGRVQGVGFRYSTVRRARDLGLTGWVRNRRDGSVELVAQGTAAAVAALVAWCGHGPSSARVDDVEVGDEALGEKFAEFETRW
jgi:acylphosphatase